MSNLKVQKNIVQWMKRQTFVKRAAGECTRFVLHHVGSSGKLGPEVMTVNVGENKQPGEAVNEEDLAGYAMEIEGEASNYAEAIGQTQTFAIAAYFEEDASKALARFAFRINVEEVEDNEELSSEGANPQGIQRQQMRHNEALMKINTGAFGSILNTLQRQNDQLSSMVEKLFNDRVEQIEAVETLISAKHQRDIEVEQQRISGEHKAKMLDNVLALLPAAANKFIGKKLLPETTDVIQMQIVRFMEALTPADAERMIASVAEPEKKVALLELFRLVQERVGAVGGDPANNNAS